MTNEDTLTRRLRCDANQRAVNYVTRRGRTDEEIRGLIVAYADQALGQYPQYAGHWDGPEWKLGVATARVKTKSGVAMEKGDVVLWRDPEYVQDAGRRFVTIYSVRNEVDTSVPRSKVRGAEGGGA